MERQLMSSNTYDDNQEEPYISRLVAVRLHKVGFVIKRVTVLKTYDEWQTYNAFVDLQSLSSTLVIDPVLPEYVMYFLVNNDDYELLMTFQNSYYEITGQTPPLEPEVPLDDRLPDCPQSDDEDDSPYKPSMN
jgi:hypothetical protein